MTQSLGEQSPDEPEPGPSDRPSEELRELAAAHGVATSFDGWGGVRSDASAATLTAVLGALGVDASSPGAVRAALADAADAPWRDTLPPVVVVTDAAGGTAVVHVRDGEPAAATAVLDDGTERVLSITDDWADPREVDGVLTGRAHFAVPAGLPLGYHALRAVTGHDGAVTESLLVVTPARLSLPASLGESGQRWGWMAQLYSVRSQRSWGLGDLADLADLLDLSGRAMGADFLLVNPLQAAEPVGHMSPSPYLPSSRRFVNPVYIRVEDVPEVAYLPGAQRAAVERRARTLRASNTDASSLDRDAVWRSKLAALELVFAVPRSRARQTAFDAYRQREGAGLADFALWCALVEHVGPGEPWPQALHDPHDPETVSLRALLAPRVELWEWLQWVADDQLAAAQAAATAAGMALGVVHDLAVGVHPAGADAWALRDVLASGVSVGAPPDDFNQQGQDWSQPPWHPRRLAAARYAPFRDMVRTILRHAGGLRVDHVIGLFRLWWVPAGRGPEQGAYVSYDHDAMVGILALEAHLAGAVLIGEDLGVVEPWVRTYLAERGVLGTSVLWFERDGQGDPLPPSDWRELCLATVTTHDLPPTAGYLAQEHVDLRERLGLLTQDVEAERATDAGQQAAVLDGLRRLGLLGEGVDPGDGAEGEEAVVEALHAFLTRTPSRLAGVSLADAVGERRTQNQPGTSDEYPNWRIPLADGGGRTVSVEELAGNGRVRALAAIFAGEGRDG